MGLLLFFCVFFAFYVNSKAWPLLGKYSHPLGFVLLVQIFLCTLPGVLIITFSDSCFGSITCDIVSDVVKEEVFVDYFIVMISFFLSVIISFLIVGERAMYVPSSKEDAIFVSVCLALTILILLFRIISVENVPILTAISGDYSTAEAQKASILRGEDGYQIPMLNFFIKYFPLYTYYASLILFVNKKISFGRLFFCFVIVAATIVYDLQKGPLAILIVASFWIYWSATGRVSSIIFGGILGGVIIGGMFFVSYDFGGDFTYLVTAILNRLFVAQVDGMYWIYSFPIGSQDYNYWGVPFATALDLKQVDPLSEIIKVVFPAASDTWVNSTTFLNGEAKALFGEYSVLFAFCAVFLNVLLVCLASAWFMRINKDLFYPAIFVMIQTLPLANNVTDLIYGRFLFGFILFMVFLIGVVLLERFFKLILSSRIRVD